MSIFSRIDTCLAGAAVVAVAAAAIPGAALGASTRVRVQPASGHPTTHFTLRFHLPQATGTFGTTTRTDTVTVSGPRHAGCVASDAVTLRPGRQGAAERVTLKPARAGGHWCTGRYTGRVVQRLSIRCGPPVTMAHVICPQMVIAPQTIARFSFRVRSGSGGSSGTQPTTGGGTQPTGGGQPSAGGSPGSGPTFAGLLSATACPSMVAHLMPTPSSFTLTWQAATDPSTPSSEIVYDVFLATSPGGENFAEPTWTTPAGATSYTTPPLSRNQPVYFVVRARDAAGLEDSNTVERQGVVQCSPTP